MRYEKAKGLLRLALQLQGSASGLTIAEMRELLDGTGRRTVERMLDALKRLFPTLEEVATSERTKRWRIPVKGAPLLADLSPEDFLSLQTAAALLRREKIADHADRLERIAAALRSTLPATGKRRVEPDFAALSEAEGLALRPGPQVGIERSVIDTLRFAIKACRSVRLHYVSRSTGARSRQLVCPYGLLLGSRHYLVAYNLNRKSAGYRNFALSNIEKAEITADTFERDEGFSLRAYAETSFGVFQEKPFDVLWKFSPQAAADARQFLFHPTQSFEDQPDGSVIVKFRAGGMLEMCWHLFRWGPQVEIVKPVRLRRAYRNLVRELHAALDEGKQQPQRE